MFRIFLISIFTFFLSVLSGCAPSEAPKNTACVFNDLEGKKVDFNELRGKWVVINYWASWCKPCFIEIPELNQFYKKYKDKNVVLLGVSFDQFDSSDALRTIVQKMGIQFPVLETSNLQECMGTQPAVLPTTYVIDPKGKMQSELLGLQTEQSLAAVIKD